MNSILIRCDGNDSDGYGHLLRCITIARGIKERNSNYTVSFIGDYSPTALTLIENRSFNYVIFEEHRADSALNLMDVLINYKYIILDSYKITQNYIDELSNKTYKFCIIADDSNVLNLSSVDLVVNYAINGQNFNYKSKSQALGLTYFPVKPELKSVRKRNLIRKRKDINHILIMIGGHDKYSVGPKILKIIDSLVTNVTITYISSSTSLGLITAKNNTLNLLPFYENIEDIYSSVDLTITGGGLSKYESNYCRVRNACVPQNINEYNDSKYFEDNGITTIIGLAYDYNEEYFSSNIANLLLMPAEPTPDLFCTNSLDNLIDKLLQLRP